MYVCAGEDRLPGEEVCSAWVQLRPHQVDLYVCGIITDRCALSDAMSDASDAHELGYEYGYIVVKVWNVWMYACMYVCRSGGVDAAIEEAKKDLKQVSQKKSCKTIFLFISALAYANEWNLQ